MIELDAANPIVRVRRPMIGMYPRPRQNGPNYLSAGYPLETLSCANGAPVLLSKRQRNCGVIRKPSADAIRQDVAKVKEMLATEPLLKNKAVAAALGIKYQIARERLRLARLELELDRK